MSVTKHSKIFSPSKSSLWLNCSLSTIFADERVESNEQAEFGTEAHELASLVVSKALSVDTFEEYYSKTIEESVKSFKHYSVEMDEIARKYSEFVVNTYDFESFESKVKPLVLIEQQLDLGLGDDSIGTLDLGIISDRKGGTLTIIDLKTGRVPVQAFDKEHNRPNSQLAIYALACYKCFKDIYQIQNVRLCIFQPIVGNTNDYELSINDLLRFENEVVIPSVEKINKKELEANEGSWCKYCPGRVNCKKRFENATESVDLSKKIITLSEEELSQILPKVDSYLAYFSDLKDYFLKKAIAGHKYDGFKLVHSRVTRKITDENKVASILVDAGYDPYSEAKLASITELTKRLGKAKFNEFVSPYISLQEGSLVLVPESDSRDEVVIQKSEEKENA